MIPVTPEIEQTYLKYSGIYKQQRRDILDVIDKNERSFKVQAEQMIAQKSLLEVPYEEKT